MVTLRVNGVPRSFDGDASTPLLWYLRDELGLTGTKFGCGLALCGACTVGGLEDRGRQAMAASPQLCRPRASARRQALRGIAAQADDGQPGFPEARPWPRCPTLRRSAGIPPSLALG